MAGPHQNAEAGSGPAEVQPHLRRGVDLPGVVALGLGTAVGVAIFSVIAPATVAAGPAMLLSVPMAAAPMLAISVTYAFLSSAVPTSGASYEWPRRFLHPFVAFLIAWLRMAGTTSALVLLAVVMSRYLAMALPVQVKPVMFVAFSLVFILNLVGVKIAGRVLTLLVSAMVLLFLTIAAWGAAHVQPSNFAPFLPHGWGGVWAALPLLVSLFLGIETATELGDEVERGRRNLPIGIAIAVLAAVALYILVAAVCIGVVGAPALAASETPILEVTSRFMGPLAKPLVITAAVLATGKSLNGITMVFSRSLFAMGRSGALPTALAKVHPRFGTPWVALSVVYALCLAGLLVPSSLTQLFLAVNVPTLLMYFAVSLSAFSVVTRHLDIYEGAQLKMGLGVMRGLSLLSALGALALVAIGFTSDWRPYALLGAWGLVGVGWYLWRARHTRAEPV